MDGWADEALGQGRHEANVSSAWGPLGCRSHACRVDPLRTALPPTAATTAGGRQAHGAKEAGAAAAATQATFQGAERQPGTATSTRARAPPSLSSSPPPRPRTAVRSTRPP
eukprot:5670277-Alexandrium_andersonii.AAC.1